MPPHQTAHPFSIASQPPTRTHSPNNRLHAQALQEPAQILLLDLHHAVLKAVDPHPRTRLAHHILKRRTEPIQPIPPLAALLLIFSLTFVVVIILLLTFRFFFFVIILSLPFPQSLPPSLP